MALSASERETAANYTDGDEVVRIFTCIRRDITAMRKKEQFVEIKTGFYPGKVMWSEFEILREDFDIARAAKTKRNLSDEQRQALSDRLKNARANSAANAAADAEESE